MLRVASRVNGLRRPQQIAAAVVLSIALALAGTYWWQTRPPQPNLSLPAGAVLAGVRGNCLEGNELYACNEGIGPRTFLTVRLLDAQVGFEALDAKLRASGWSRIDRGRLGRDNQTRHPLSRSVSPLWCRDGGDCIGIWADKPREITLAWWRD